MNPAAFAAILAGGPGTRLWPLSRKRKPKPFLKVISGDSLLKATCKRLRGVIPPSRTLVVTGAETAGLVTQGLPRLPKNNVLAEPEGRNTAASIGFAAVHARSRNPKAVLAVLPADHHIADGNKFRLLLQSAIAWSWETDDIVTLGIPADRPEIGYGYLRMGETIGERGGNSRTEGRRLCRKAQSPQGCQIREKWTIRLEQRHLRPHGAPGFG